MAGRTWGDLLAPLAQRLGADIRRMRPDQSTLEKLDKLHAGSGDKLVRFAEAYVMIAQKTKYRPRAPHDVLLDETLLDDPERLLSEAFDYAVEFCAEEDELSFCIGCSHFPTSRAFVLCIEAARLLAAGDIVAPERVKKLLTMALGEINAASRSQ